MEKKEEKTPTNQHKKHPKPTTKKPPTDQELQRQTNLLVEKNSLSFIVH